MTKRDAHLEFAISRLLRRQLLQQSPQLRTSFPNRKLDRFDNRLLEGILVDDELVERGFDLGESDQFGARARGVGGPFAGGRGGRGADQVGHDRDKEGPSRGGGCASDAYNGQSQRVRKKEDEEGGRQSCLTPDGVVLPSSDKSEADQSQRSEAVKAFAVSVDMWGSEEDCQTDNLAAVVCFGGGIASTPCSAAAGTSLAAICPILVYCGKERDELGCAAAEAGTEVDQSRAI